jgi:hypothetical protein
MSTASELVLLHVVIGCDVVLCLANIRGRMADLTYEARMGTFLRHFLMPGRSANREVWVRQQKLLSWIGLVLGGVIYVLVMIKILL